jgi:hypothetical protein
LTVVQETPVQLAEQGLLPCQLASAGGLPNAVCRVLSAVPAEA